MATRVEVKPIDRKKWHGKTGKESFAQPQTIQALANAETMEYAVELTEEDHEFFKNKNVNYDLSLQYNPEEPHPFWDTKTPRIKLENRTMFFNKELPLDRIKVGIMRASKFVANSKKQYEEGGYPEATHYIHDESREVERVASKISLRNDAIIETTKLNPERKIHIIKVLKGTNLKNQTPDFIIKEMDKLIEKNPEAVLRAIRREPKETATLSIVYEALDKGVLREDGHTIKYMDSTLGTSPEEVMEYFMKDKNQEFYLLIRQKLE